MRYVRRCATPSHIPTLKDNEAVRLGDRVVSLDTHALQCVCVCVGRACHSCVVCVFSVDMHTMGGESHGGSWCAPCHIVWSVGRQGMEELHMGLGAFVYYG